MDGSRSSPAWGVPLNQLVPGYYLLWNPLGFPVEILGKRVIAHEISHFAHPKPGSEVTFGGFGDRAFFSRVTGSALALTTDGFAKDAKIQEFPKVSRRPRPYAVAETLRKPSQKQTVSETSQNKWLQKRCRNNSFRNYENIWFQKPCKTSSFRNPATIIAKTSGFRILAKTMAFRNLANSSGSRNPA